MEQLREYIPFLIPIILIELALAITALVHVLKHPNYRFGTKTFWILVVLFIQIIGPITYFAFGREES